MRRVVDEIERRLREPLQQAVRGALGRAARTRRPRPAEIDWDRTIRANLRHYQPAHGTIVPETLHGTARRRRALREVVLLVDQSGSMASSVVYAGVLGAALASLPALTTRLVAFASIATVPSGKPSPATVAAADPRATSACVRNPAGLP